ncbi:MAG: dihydroorotate dehydrogenase electron transfer subunit [Anaerolineaceae bacterium]|nr:MAG: dihydroorotate dehydrogenase electron transfer subunit [Anaerolineaceae bacterium]
MSVALKRSIKVLQNDRIEEGVYDLWLQAEDMAATAKQGQFISLYCNDGGRLLPRPISICEIDQKSGRVRLVYRVVGKGTEEFAGLKPGDEIDCIGPLGNGFTLEGKKALIVGGGIGIPPLLELAKQLKCKKNIVLGYRDDTFLYKEFEEYGNVYLSTENGSRGTKGNVLDAIKDHNLTADIIYACGPTPMLRGIKEYAEANQIKAQLSLEERMACGIGACLACVCQTSEKDHHSNVNNKRICKEGPVFYADEIVL